MLYQVGVGGFVRVVLPVGEDFPVPPLTNPLLLILATSLVVQAPPVVRQTAFCLVNGSSGRLLALQVLRILSKFTEARITA